MKICLKFILQKYYFSKGRDPQRNTDIIMTDYWFMSFPRKFFFVALVSKAKYFYIYKEQRFDKPIKCFVGQFNKIRLKFQTSQALPHKDKEVH